MKKATALISVFIALLFLGETLGAEAPAEGIRVGVLLPLTGKLAEFGKIERKSFLMAVDEINGTGFIQEIGEEKILLM